MSYHIMTLIIVHIWKKDETQKKYSFARFFAQYEKRIWEKKLAPIDKLANPVEIYVFFSIRKR